MHYVKYYDDGYIAEHKDLYKNNSILLTLIIYLNDNYQQGETYFYNPKTKCCLPIIVKKGKGIIFPGGEITHGCYKVKGIKKILIASLLFE